MLLASCDGLWRGAEPSVSDGAAVTELPTLAPDAILANRTVQGLQSVTRTVPAKVKGPIA